MSIYMRQKKALIDYLRDNKQKRDKMETDENIIFCLLTSALSPSFMFLSLFVLFNVSLSCSLVE